MTLPLSVPGDSTAMKGGFYFTCFLLVMLGWFVFVFAFIAFGKKKPAKDAPPPPGPAEPVKRDPRSMIGVRLQMIGYFLMWISYLPPFPSLTRVPTFLAPVLAVAAVVLAWSSGALAVWARRTLGREWTIQARLIEGHRLVTDGPYALVRHPIYAAMCGLWIATALAIARPFGIALGALPMAWGTWIRVSAEDGLLRGAFGETFEAWKRRVPALIPYLVPARSDK